MYSFWKHLQTFLPQLFKEYNIKININPQNEKKKNK